MKVIHLHRKPREGFFSIENIFEGVRREIRRTKNLEIKKIELPFTCKTHLGKLCNMFFVLFIKADVFHITGDAHYVSAFLPKNKTIITAHDVEGIRGKASGVKGKLFKWMYFIVPNKKCKIWTTVSQGTKKELVDYINCPQKKVKLIYNPIPYYFKKGKNKAFNKECPRILHQGNHPRKNLDKVIRALKNIPCELIILGRISDKQKKELEKNNTKYKEYNKLSNQEILNLYQDIDIVEVASLYESFGLSIVEAQYLGLPIVLSNNSAMPEVAGDGACYVQAENENEIRQGIEKIINDEEYRNGIIEEGYENVKRFALGKIAEEYYQCYLGVFEG